MAALKVTEIPKLLNPRFQKIKAEKSSAVFGCRFVARLPSPGTPWHGVVESRTHSTVRSIDSPVSNNPGPGGFGIDGGWGLGILYM
jgi:hypothetical protein